MANFEELNALLLDRCVAYARAHPHPEQRDRTVWEMFEAARPSLVRYAGRLDGFRAAPAAVSKTCLVRFDSNKCSVSASAVGKPVEVRAYAERIELRQDGRVVASFGGYLAAVKWCSTLGIMCRRLDWAERLAYSAGREAGARSHRRSAAPRPSQWEKPARAPRQDPQHQHHRAAERRDQTPH